MEILAMKELHKLAISTRPARCLSISCSHAKHFSAQHMADAKRKDDGMQAKEGWSCH